MKFDKTSFVNFELVAPSFKFTTADYESAVYQFDNVGKPASLYGIKPNGDVTLIKGK